MIKNLTLLVVAISLLSILITPAILLTLIISIKNFKTKKIKTYLSESFLLIALSIDRLGNVIAKDLFNVYFLKNENCYKFGNTKETISSAAGKNILYSKSTKVSKYSLTLNFYFFEWKVYNFSYFKYSNFRFFGNLLVNILDHLDKNHCLNSIDNNV